MGTRDEEAAMLASRTLNAMSPKLKALADSLDVDYRTVKAWKAGDRSPSPENLEKLAALASEQSDDLYTLARDLNRAAERKRYATKRGAQ